MIIAKLIPQDLKWTDFKKVARDLRDPNDGKIVDALTTFNFNISFKGRKRRVGQKVKFPANGILKITPNARVNRKKFDSLSSNQLDSLLKHEEIHYQVGFICARSLAIDLEATLVSPKKLKSALNTLVKLHLNTRAGIIQKAYDHDTSHGTNALKQKKWLQQMQNCLQNPTAKRIGSHLL